MQCSRQRPYYGASDIGTLARMPPPALHALESEVMEEMWRQGEATVREVMDGLNRGRAKKRAYTTYMTILARLDRKGLLTRRREGKTDVYAPLLTRDEYMDARAGDEVETLVDEFGDIALVHFARQMGKLDRRRQEQLRRLARRADGS
jgi:predicted transcriptional regulator